MKVMCAWCRKGMNEVSDESAPVSHGICDSCKENLIFQLGVDTQRYLDSLKVPVALVDSAGIVKAANSIVQAMLHKTPPQINDHLGGVVFECAYSRLPGGCGQTVHCSGCTIRNAVMATHTTGRPGIRVPAVLNQGEAAAPTPVKMVITTEKSGDLVMLRIDAAE